MTETTATLQQIGDSVRQINADTFFKFVEFCIHGPKSSMLKKRRPETGSMETEFIQKEIDAEANRIHAVIALTLNSIAGLSSETEDKNGLTRFYTRSMKQQQAELLMEIGDEIDIVKTAVQRSDRVRKLLGEHRASLEEAGALLSIIRERLENRPSFIMFNASRDEKIQSLNQTFETMREFESTVKSKFSGKCDDRNSDKLSDVIDAPLNDTTLDINIRKKRITALTAELRAGFRILNRLAKHGYSWSMKRKIDKLVDRHNNRICEFQERVRSCRSTFPEPAQRSYDRPGSHLEESACS